MKQKSQKHEIKKKTEIFNKYILKTLQHFRWLNNEFFSQWFTSHHSTTINMLDTKLWQRYAEFVFHSAESVR